MKKSRAAMLVAGALVLGLALGGLGIASAANHPTNAVPSASPMSNAVSGVGHYWSGVTTATPSVPATRGPEIKARQAGPRASVRATSRWHRNTGSMMSRGRAASHEGSYQCGSGSSGRGGSGSGCGW